MTKKQERELRERIGKKEQQSRARKMVKILNKHYDRHDHRASVVDALADLRHFCDVKGIDYYDCERSSYRHYIAEKIGED